MKRTRKEWKKLSKYWRQQYLNLYDTHWDTLQEVAAQDRKIFGQAAGLDSKKRDAEVYKWLLAEQEFEYEKLKAESWLGNKEFYRKGYEAGERDFKRSSDDTAYQY